MEIINLHDTLDSEDEDEDEDEDAAAHIAVALWDTTLAIPAPPGYLRPMITAEQDCTPTTTTESWTSR